MTSRAYASAIDSACCCATRAAAAPIDSPSSTTAAPLLEKLFVREPCLEPVLDVVVLEVGPLVRPFLRRISSYLRRSTASLARSA